MKLTRSKSMWRLSTTKVDDNHRYIRYQIKQLKKMISNQDSDSDSNDEKKGK